MRSHALIPQSGISNENFTSSRTLNAVFNDEIQAVKKVDTEEDQ